MHPTLTISHFKSIIQQTVELGAVNVFIGANGSGKSNILEAMGILGAAAYGQVDDSTLLRYGVRPGVPRLYKSAFEDTPIKPHIHFNIASDNAYYAVSLNNSLERTSRHWQFKTEEFKSYGKRILSRGPKSGGDKSYGFAPTIFRDQRPDDPSVILLKALKGFGIYTPNTQTLRGLAPDSQSRDPLGLSGGRLAEAVSELQKFTSKNEAVGEVWEEILALVDWMSEMDSVPFADDLLSPAVPRQRGLLRFTDRFMRQRKNALTAHDASEGVLYVLAFATLVLHPGAPKWLAIDNADQALNPRLIQRLLSLICHWIRTADPDRCLMLTVHNPTALDGLPLTDDRIRLFVVNRTIKGHTVIDRITISEELQKKAADNSWPLSRLWVMGLLGGLPNV